jgi:hypothetical protein
MTYRYHILECLDFFGIHFVLVLYQLQKMGKFGMEGMVFHLGVEIVIRHSDTFEICM